MSAAGKLSLTFKQKSVTTLKAGRYTLSVADLSKTAGFSLQNGKRTLAVTGAALVGKRSRVITLTAGQWAFFTPGRSKSFFVVSA